MAKMPSPVSINETMSRMSKRMDAILDEQARANPAKTDEISQELQIWLSVDPLLSDLHKQMQDAKAHHAQLLKLHGQNDPMTDVAFDMKDSAQTMFDVRLLELREQEDIRIMVDTILRKQQNAAEAERVEAVRLRAASFWSEFSRSKPRERKTKGAESLWLVLIGVMALQQTLQNARQQLSLASAFGQASSENRRLKHHFAGC